MIQYNPTITGSLTVKSVQELLLKVEQLENEIKLIKSSI
jgi:hypothetical protein